MKDRTALLESALDNLPQGVALRDREGVIVFWNQAAAAITGFAAADLMGRAIPEALRPLATPIFEPSLDPCLEPCFATILESQRRGETRLGGAEPGPKLVRARHKFGHEISAITHSVTLCDPLGEILGFATLFHPADQLDALPHGDPGARDRALETTQAELEERLQLELEDFERGGHTFGVLWIAVDQRSALRGTHGAAACQEMMEKVRRALASGLRPAEEMGRWGDEEFLVIAHERTPEMLMEHARTLAGLARTADLRWWGDRISLTVSVGAAQAGHGEPLTRLLERARQAMQDSTRAGGNRVTFVRRQAAENLEAAHIAGEQA